MMIATSHVQFKCSRGNVFLRWEPFAWVVPSCFIGRRTTSKNLISSRSKFQEFEHIHHKVCLSCGFCAWVASPCIWSNQIKEFGFYSSHMLSIMCYFIQSWYVHTACIFWEVPPHVVFWTWESSPPPFLIWGDIGKPRSVTWLGVETWYLILIFNSIWFGLNLWTGRIFYKEIEHDSLLPTTLISGEIGATRSARWSEVGLRSHFRYFVAIEANTATDNQQFHEGKSQIEKPSKAKLGQPDG